jgi:hypothetical protein
MGKAKLNDVEMSELLDQIHFFCNEYYNKNTSDFSEKIIATDKYGTYFKIINENEIENYKDSVLFSCTKNDFISVGLYKPKK